jgi:hypothetical protein
MNPSHKAILDRAIEIVTRDNLVATRGKTIKEITDKDVVIPVGSPVWSALSRSETKKNGYPTYHMVFLVSGKFHCDCIQGKKSGKVCAHKAAAYIAKQEEDKEAQAALVAEIAKANAERDASFLLPVSSGPSFHRGRNR